MNPKQQKSGFINQVSSKHEPPEPCKTLPKPTPAEALALRIKLPWEGKVQRMRPEDLTKELFMGLEAYGVTRLEISVMFHIFGNKLQPMLREWNIPRAPTGGANRAARAGNLEKPPVPGAAPVMKTRPGQSTGQYIEAAAKAKKAGADEPVTILTEDEMDAELARVEIKLAKIEANEISTQSADRQPVPTRPDSVDIAVEVPHIASREEVRQFFASNEDENGLNYQDRCFLVTSPEADAQAEADEWAHHKNEAEKELDAMAIDAETQQLEACLVQAARELGGFPAAGLQIGLMVGTKQQQYGDTISSLGPLLRALYPDGIGHNQYDELALIVQILDKIGRITKGNGQGSEDAWGDLAGYALLGQAGLQRKSA